MVDDFPLSHGPRKKLLDDNSLFDAITKPSTIKEAWSRVWTNGGAAGGDGISLDFYSKDLLRRLDKLHDDLRSGHYHPGPVRVVDIPRSSGKGLRRLSIPSVNDRIIQTAAASCLSSLLDEEFEENSYGYRKGKSVQQAVAQISLAQRQGNAWLVDADIKSYFDHIPHNGLMERWAESCTPGPLTQLIWSWITSASPSGRGVAQGSPISPLLANLYLDRLDEAFARQDARIVRFADDFVILCQNQHGAEAAMGKVKRLLEQHGLELNEEKSQVRNFDQGFKFLGHLFVRSLVIKTAPERADESEIQRWMNEVAQGDAKAEQDRQRQISEEAAKEARGYSPGLRVLYVYEADRRLSIRNQAFIVQEWQSRAGRDPKWFELIAIPHQDIDRIELGPHVAISDEAERHALATDTPVAFVNGHGETIGWLANSLSPRAERHLAQAAFCLDQSKSIELARRIVDGRLRNQRAVLRRLLNNRAHPPKIVSDALIHLNRIIGRPGKGPLYKADTISELMGCEGAATAAWWRALCGLMPSEMAFQTRSRPANDCANVCFNFLSWLLTRDISVAIMRAGLHPGFGVLHKASDRRDACVYDLIEEFRAHLIGGLTVYCANRKMLTVEMFDISGDTPRMKREASSSLIRAYENRVTGKVTNPRTGKKVTWRQLMVDQAFSLAACYEGGSVYQPYIMDY
ncbi:MAG: CRISPR-associated endonuclease Cas1 [Cohaesibacter sp.]|nr:CRISPR-associated endonuclease Cas1 [Cohaesibacter sp.]